MSLSSEDFKRIKEEFQQEYFLKEPFLEYVIICSVSRVGSDGKSAPIGQKGDICISVGLNRPFPPDLALPTEYRGVRILVEVIENFRLLAGSKRQ